MDRETRLFLIRHAPVAGSVGVIHDPEAPADTGDVAAIGWLRAQLPADKIAICSPARRTRDTAAALGLDPVREAAFREQAFGAWTGRRHAELAAEYGDAYKNFWLEPAGNRPPGGESFVDQIARVEHALAALPQGDVALVVHSGTIRAVLAIALDLPPDRALSFVIDPWSLTRIDRLANGWRIVAVNHTRPA
ncbi:histidine phosphatase family protein [Bradyrhizobium sp.]|uniref:histidine phosphatase family protein n=1 Tax=Bradyrhizobium sp. TaxID=376 RepID=UPI00238E684A|nr:histidine phosphatase family protein [Bradyrhizobium sp.]MDE2378823.1 histidine phosphatase family protein [Bradyrhizobium sp.]